jgi:hypothetical protein
VELEAALKELDGVKVGEAVARGMGKWEGYGIHTLSIALRLMGHKVQRVIDTGTKTARAVTLDYGDGRRALLDVRTAANEYHEFPWTFGARVGERYVSGQVKDFDGFYANLMRRAAAFFKAGVADMAVEEALTAVAVLESAEKSRAAGGEWIPIPELLAW